ncbi:MAG TPA: hypothetical protein VHT28_03090 [Silvibacterium sp.]|jgi:hypothetical protein|nr:hypothetical protein [Silvibacterium sp.]
MTEEQTIPQVIPQPLADRYLAVMTDLISIAHQAVDVSDSPQAGVWRQKLLPLLDSRLFAAKTAMIHLAIGDENPLLAHALQSRFLARDMDGYPLDFAGEKFAEQLKEKQQFVVYAAWQICQSAGVV